MRRRGNLFKNIDWLTVYLYLILAIIGWAIIYATDYQEEHSSLFSLKTNYGRQFIWICSSLIVAFFILLIETKFYTAFAYVIYGLIMVLLVATIFLAPELKGSRSWFEIGSVKIQPAEFAKFAAGLAIAKYIASINVNMRYFRYQIAAILLFAVPATLIILQGDTGSALVYAAFILVLFREGLQARYLVLLLYLAALSVVSLMINKYLLIALLVGIAAFICWRILIKTKKQRAVVVVMAAGILILSSAYIIGVDYVFNNVLKPHQQERVNVLLGKETDMKGAGYNVMQSKIAIGSGGFFGKGFREGTQTQFNFVPEQSTDFIFCTVGEEHGFLGSFILLGLFLALLLRIVFLAERQRSKFSRVYIYGVASILFFHIMINIGMTIGLAPVIGIPLPMISYGGSSLLGFTILIFIMLKLDAERLTVLR